MAHYNVVVAHKVGEKTHYTRVGAMFENFRQGTNETFYKIVLDFPVGVTELLAFAPRASDAPESAGSERGS